MFETVLGIPAHPLIVHAVVVFVPLLILAALAYGFVPALRRRVGWVLVGLAVIAPASALMAKLSGDLFVRRLIRRHETSERVLSLLRVHRSYGTMTLYLSIALAVAALVLVVLNRWVGRRAGGQSRNDLLRWYALAGVTLVLGAVTGYYVFKTGDTGAHIVWQGF